MDFGEYIKDLALAKDLNENTLYKDQAERAALLNDKPKVVDAFIFNFIGVLGLINGAANTNDVARLKRYFANDKKLFVSSIGDDNNDISLAVRLMHDADMFQSQETVNEITRFLARLKTGKVDPVDSRIVAGWLKKLKPDFVRNINDQQMKKAVFDFIQDGGETTDMSGLAILLKRKMRKFDVAGDFQEFAKRVKIADRKPPHTIGGTGVTTIDDMLAGAPVHSRAKKDVAAAQLATAQPADGTAAAATPDPTTKRVVAKATPTPPPPPKVGITTKLKASDMISSLFYAQREYAVTRLTPTYRKNTDEDVKIITKFIESQDALTKGIMTLGVPSIRDAFKHLADNINASDLVELPVYPETVKDMSSNTRSGYDNREKYPMTGVADLVYSYEVNQNDVLSFDHNHIKFIYDSSLTFKNELIDAILNGKSYPDIIDRGRWSYGKVEDEKSDAFRVLAMYLMKVAKENATFQDVVDSIEKSGVYYKGRVYSDVLGYLELGSLASNTYAGVNIKAAYDMQIRSLESFNNPPDSMNDAIWSGYKSSRKKFALYSYIERTYKDDLILNGLSNSILLKGNTYPGGSFNLIKYMFEDFDIDPKKMLQTFPSDPLVVEFIVRMYGIDEVSDKMLKAYVENSAIRNVKEMNRSYFSRANIVSDEDVKKTPQFIDEVFNRYKDIYRKASTPEKVNNLVLETIEENPAIYDSPIAFSKILHLLPNMEKSSTIRLAKIAKQNNFKSFFNPDLYKNTNRKAEKDEFVAAFTGIMNDAIGTDVEDYISDILETMPGGVTYKIRQSLVGISKLVEEVNSGTIQPFGSIDDKRLKTMLSMNDIDFASIVTADVGRKKKGETWVEYFKRAKDTVGKTGTNALGKERVELTSENPRSLTKIYNEFYRSGKHGDTYARIDKIYSSDLEYPEFKEFRKTNFGDGTITPAFHGTGGIAATMILRYGFKVIKSTDSSVVGRMLGDGIYFSNKLDKALQYIGNSGYGRDYGTRGYIFEVDNTLGNEDKTRSTSKPDYRVMGLGGDNIRSPEWCVRDPKKQLAIRKVYEVELISKRTYDGLLNENQGVKSFKEYMTERKLMNINNNVVSFLFRDGELPIFDKNGNLSFVDFEEAITNGLIPANMIDYSMQGPVVVFDAAEENKVFDIRFADAMNGEAYQLYEKYFFEKVLGQ